MIRRRVLVTGLVQGVYFREMTRRLAERESVSGWVRNRWDGNVEAVFEGEPHAVGRLVAFCSSGPHGARVDHLAIFEEAPEGIHGFSVTG